MELPEQLADTTIVVLGLMEMGYSKPRAIAEILHRRETASLRKLLYMLRHSRNPIIRQCVDVGLPAGLVRPLPYPGTKVACPLCGAWVDHVPCLRCSLTPSRSDQEPVRKPRRRDKRPTASKPGSLGKLDILRRRAERGLELFHPRDACYCHESEQ